MVRKQIKGRKGGGGNATTPVESPDSLNSLATAKILLAIGCGEFFGVLNKKNTYLDGTVIQNADGTENFPGVRLDFRPGTQSQTYIPGMPNVENEITVNTELKSDTPWVRSIANIQLSAVRLRFGFPSLQRQSDNGDVGGYRIEYAIDVSTDGGAYVTLLSTAVDGKTTTLYERSHRINLPRATTGWQIRVRRITPNATSGRIADKMNVEAIAEVIDAKLRYPNTALLYLEFDATQFQNIPAISWETETQIVKVPSNYNPTTREYTGVWDGSFKWAYTNNPVWCSYAVETSKMDGLGRRIDTTQIDKWELYRIAQYCDQLIPDGRGGSGTEPRFTCDVCIQSQAEAFTVLRDLAAIYRGMTYWGNNQLRTMADMPRDVDYIFTRANVIDGRFTYGGGSEKKRYTTAMVSWSDPANNFQDAIEAVSDNDLVRRYGINQIDMTAIGCIRQTEANRRGRWALLTNSKDRIVNFNVGLDGAIPLPGHIIGVADEMLSGRKMGGRISEASGRNITLDRVADVKAGDRLLVNLPSGVAQGRTVQTVNGKIVTVTTAYSETLAVESGWSIDADDLAIQQYRVTGIADNDDNTYSISAVQHDPDKYERIDTGARIDERPISVIPPGVQPPPTNVVIDSFSALSQGLAVTTLRVTWEPAASAIAYEAEWRRDNGNWISAPRTSAQGFQVEGIYAGQYQARVRAINPSEISSVWANAQETTLNGKEGNPPMPVGFATTGILFGITLNWGYPEGAEDALKTEIEYSLSADGTDTMLLSDVPHPQRNYTMQGLRAGQVFWFRARIVDKSGNQSPWIDWVRGMSSTDTSAILEAIGDDFISNTVAGQQLFNNDFMNAEAILENAVANDAGIVQQWAQYGENKAGVIHLTTTVADAERAFAEFETLVTATFEDQTAAIDEKLTAVVDSDGASATYSLRAGINYNGQLVNAGMVIGAEFINGVAKSSIGFNADQFILLSGPAGNVSSPFAVVNGQTFINDAYIAKASIGRGKITDTLESDNFAPSSTGLKIDFKNGTIEQNGYVPGEGRKFSSNLREVVYNERNEVVVVIGKKLEL
ncbi:host specificity protein J [Yersinia enterocolitica]|uniref:Phage host specificity protein n=1 Tax=Yersinia enterocolitica serotype O:8 / biotype 1B (strain NCTC 13174 / 8081) TaxID=393305 RepID=A1JQT8_YERE8|nr:host specificity protein J [Yersinia enterocolitica]AJJ24959.1 fibronectin type III domain protein [Yersinia enterocolitica]CAL12355.1 putative phage host specificity protein [Yersinia enterocolitica subsp. enterocolitica 8081]HDL8280455.1 host specificity protein J [Yersinia enterocolitica]